MSEFSPKMLKRSVQAQWPGTARTSTTAQLTDEADVANHDAPSATEHASSPAQLRVLLNRGPRAARLADLGAALQRTPRVAGLNTAGVIQTWRDHLNAWHDPPEPKANDENWILVDEPDKRYFKPRPGSQKAKEYEEAEARKKAEGVERQVKGKARVDELSRKSKDYKTIFLEDPSKILYTQDSIAGTFANGNKIQTLVDALKNGSVTAGDVEPLMVQLYDRKLYSYDNRRLWAFKKANLQVRCRFGSPREIKANEFKLTGTGTKITVRD
jgi:hypothetical protein